LDHPSGEPGGCGAWRPRFGAANLGTRFSATSLIAVRFTFNFRIGFWRGYSMMESKSCTGESEDPYSRLFLPRSYNLSSVYYEVVDFLRLSNSHQCRRESHRLGLCIPESEVRSSCDVSEVECTLTVAEVGRGQIRFSSASRNSKHLAARFEARHFRAKMILSLHEDYWRLRAPPL
jgi:hypothetical protein